MFVLPSVSAPVEVGEQAGTVDQAAGVASYVTPGDPLSDGHLAAPRQ